MPYNPYNPGAAYNYYNNMWRPQQQAPKPPPPDPGTQFGNQGTFTNGVFSGSGDQYNDIYKSVGLKSGDGDMAKTIGNRLLPAEFYHLANQYGFYNSLQPMAQQSAGQMLSLLSNPDAMTQQYRNQAMASGQSTLQGVLQRLKSGGAGIGAVQGAQMQALNQANSAGNQYQAQMDSAQGRAQRLNSILGIISGQMPNLSNLQGLQGMTAKQQQQSQGGGGLGGFLAAAAPIIGSFL
jgi:hypothetical protein